METVASGTQRPDVLDLLPLKNEKDIAAFEEELNKGRSNRSAVKRELARIGGVNERAVTLNLLRAMFSYEVAMTYSWYGLKGNKRLKEMETGKIIVGKFIYLDRRKPTVPPQPFFCCCTVKLKVSATF